jgi:pimeloyl-ACP methyl ester carboxylesterase
VLDGVPWDPDTKRGWQAIDDALRSDGVEAAKAAWLRHGLFAPAQRRPEVARRLAEMVHAHSGVSWTSTDPRTTRPIGVERLSTIDAPTTVVIGELDVSRLHEMAGILTQRIRGGLTIPDAGHMVNMEAPEAVTALLREVVLGVSAS